MRPSMWTSPTPKNKKAKEGRVYESVHPALFFARWGTIFGNSWMRTCNAEKIPAPCVGAAPTYHTPLEKGGGMAEGYAGGFLFSTPHPGQKPPVSSADSPLFKGAFFVRRWAAPTPDTFR